MVFYIIGYILRIEGGAMLLPALTGWIYLEEEGIAYVIAAGICLFAGTLLTIKKPKNTSIFAKEGFVITSLSWIALSIFGALPMLMCGDITDYASAFFEVVSGFTTTGASIITDYTNISHATNLWRCLTHWLGGMGLLVFMLAIIPMSGGQTMHIMKAESPGPVVGKLVPRMRQTAGILYKIYFALTVVELALLVISGVPFFDSVCYTFATAGTGGFSISNAGFSEYSVASKVIITVFMILFGVNFNTYYFILKKKFKEAFTTEEVIWYFVIYFISVGAITANIYNAGLFDSVPMALHHASFNAASIMTTTGFAISDFNLWPDFSKFILLLLMFIGACAGSTAGGIKVVRILVCAKSVLKEFVLLLHPRAVIGVRINGHIVPDDRVRSALAFIFLYIILVVIAMLCYSLLGADVDTALGSSISMLSNVGPATGSTGPASNFAHVPAAGKWLMSAYMLIGRLEIFTILFLFMPSFWKDRK
jgi:trk system potassium uptake protein TrkH